jgi:acetyltransferase
MKKTMSALFTPNRIAVFGSVKEGKIGHQLVTQLITGGFSGTVYAVNPKAAKPAGFPDITAAASLESTGPVDLALISVPPQYVRDSIEQCGKNSVTAAVIFTAGFSETGNTEMEREVAETAERYGVRLLGPNCAGIMNTASFLYASIEVQALPGKAAFISQSGAVGGAVLALGRDRGLGFSKFASYGNRIDLDETVFLPYLADDPETEVIGVYLESMQDGRGFMEAVRKAGRKKPVVVLKSGKSGAGKRAAGSHTGALAGSDDVFDAMIRQSGLVRADSLEELLDLLQAFSSCRLRGNRIAVVTNSGGPGILTTDTAEDSGLSIPETSRETRRELETFLPPQCAFANPVDLTVEGTKEGYRKSLEAMLTGGYEGAIVINVATPFLDSKAIADGIIEGASAAGEGKPVAAVFMAGDMVREGSARLRAAGIPLFSSGERAARAFAGMYRYHAAQAEMNEADVSEAKEGPRTGSGRSPGSCTPRGNEPDLHPAPVPGTAAVLEPDAVRFFENLGLPFPAHAFVSRDEPGETLAEKAESVGFPMVMKVVSPEVLHKSDVGGVVLGISDPETVSRTFDRMKEQFGGRGFRGVMLYRQIEPALEMIAGIKRDGDFGPVLLAGAGGVFTEILEDSSVRIAPVTRREAGKMIEELKVGKLLGGYRGGKPLNRGKLEELLCSLSEIAVRYPEIEEADLNPVFLTESDVLVGDVRILTVPAEDP